MIDEGYIKFTCHHQITPPLLASDLRSLNHFRQLMYRHTLIGAYDNGIGFGNISRRQAASNRFIISGTATGHLPRLTDEHYALVTDVSVATNELWCSGPVRASSESMSHFVIYQHCRDINAVIHVHNLKLWQYLLHRVPTTDASATYGTPEMAAAIVQLLEHTNLSETGLFVMEGHQEGIFAFGENLAQASEKLTQYIRSWEL